MSARTISKWILVAGVAVLGFYWYPVNWFARAFIGSLYDAMAAGLIAISVTVLLIDGANEQRDARQLKKRLVWEMGSSDQAFAIRAAKELRDAGWLTNGSLKSVDLTLANLQRAQLSNACLEGVILAKSNLGWANLEEANLRNANLEGVIAESVNMRRAHIEGAILRGAKMPNAVLEDVSGEEGTDLLGASFIRANLRGAALKSAQLEECDFFEADMTGIDLTSATMLRANVAGATLANANLERADLSEIEGWSEINSITGARISGVRSAPVGFRSWAVEHGAVDSSLARETPSDSRPRTTPSNTVETLPDSQQPEAPRDLKLVQGGIGADESLSPGDRVSHDSFGIGTIKQVLGDGSRREAKIDFSGDVGIKHLVIRYAPMKKID